VVDDETQRTDRDTPAEAEAVEKTDPVAAAAAAAFAETIGLFHDDMARVAFVVAGDVELAGEAAQGAWPEAWKDIATPRNPERLRAWLMGLAAKEAKWLTDAGTRHREEAARGDAGVITTQAATTSAYRSDELDLANVFAAIDSHDRQIVALRYVAGLTSDDIGRELGMPGSAVQARVARILKLLLEAVRGLEVDGDAVEAYERALAQRIRSFANRAVVPLDPQEIAKNAIAQAAAEISTADRLVHWLEELLERVRAASPLQLGIAGGAVVVVLLLTRGGGAPPILAPTPFPTDATRLCEPHELELRVTQWAEAGADRVAIVAMENVGGIACLVDNLPEPWFVEAGQIPMLIGNDFVGTLIRIGPGDVLRTTVRVRNYCGPEPRPPVSLAFRRDSFVMVAKPLTTTDLSGVPPCGGYPGTPDDVQMTPWAF
jgi:DNA-directed RNA polymerase specialized sigma24 family protein